MARDMSSPNAPIPRLKINSMSPVFDDQITSASASPARGRETRTALLQKLRPPPLVHAWDCWIERPSSTLPTNGNSSNTTTTTKDITSEAYKSHLTHLLSISDIKAFWSLMNNLPLTSLPSRYTCALFHRGVKPLWEDSRNSQGGAWTFRVPRASAQAFFTDLCLLAIGEQLQDAIEDKTRTTFRDDICGVTYSPRNSAMVVVAVWNRDARNEDGKKRLLEKVLEGVGKESKPKDGSWYYKRHDEHAGFVMHELGPGQMDQKKKNEEVAATAPWKTSKHEADTTAGEAPATSEEAATTMEKLEADVRTVRRILDELKLSTASNGHTESEVPLA